jgi:hypothetical protein
MDSLILSAVALAINSRRRSKIRRRRRPRSCWAKKWLLRREELGLFNTLLKELAAEEPTDYKNWMRMDEATFYELLGKVGPLITKQDTNMRQSIPPAQRLAITLRYMATGEYNTYHLNTAYYGNAI